MKDILSLSESQADSSPGEEQSHNEIEIYPLSPLIRMESPTGLGSFLTSPQASMALSPYGGCGTTSVW